MNAYWEKLQELLAAGSPFASITLVDVVASAPQNVGAKMLVTTDGLYWGTVGGGKIEAKSIAEARTMIAQRATNRFAEWNLQKDVGMTCGGVVKLFFETYNIAHWPIWIFGAGHCSQALTRLLLTLRCQITVVDPRPEWLAKLPESSPSATLKKIHADKPPVSYVTQIPPNAFVLMMTMGHASDQPILIEILKTREFPYVGVIGSDAKAAALRKGLREAAVPENLFNRYLCPIGLPIGTNDPAEIAISIAAQLLERRDAAVPASQ